MKIHRAGPEHVNSVHMLRAALAAETGEYHPHADWTPLPSTWGRALVDTILSLDNTGDAVWLAEKDGELQGYLWASLRGLRFYEAHTASIRESWIQPQYRKGTLFGRLFRECLAWFRENGVKSYHLSTSVANRDVSMAADLRARPIGVVYEATYGLEDGDGRVRTELRREDDSEPADDRGTEGGDGCSGAAAAVLRPAAGSVQPAGCGSVHADA